MKPTVLALSEVYLPGYLAGGPVRSLAGLVEALGDEFDWKIITTDRDLGAKRAYADIQPDQWMRVGKATVWYASPSSLRPSAFCRLLRESHSDLLYLNSFFSPRFSILPVVAARLGLLNPRPVLIAPRGEFSRGALRLKRWKKVGYLKLARIAALYRAVRWHATADIECDDIMRTLGIAAGHISVARNLAPAVVATTMSPRPPGSSLRVCFLARVSKMKNLDFALRVLARVVESVVFTVYGPIEDSDYWVECLQLVGRLPRNVAFQYKGPVAHDEVQRCLAQHDLFFLPTRGENFGHALIEAWSAGLPVLTSDQTPWRDLMSKGVGWDFPLGDQAQDQFVAVINSLAKMGVEESISMRGRAVGFAASLAANHAGVEDSRKTLLAAIGSSSGS